MWKEKQFHAAPRHKPTIGILKNSSKKQRVYGVANGCTWPDVRTLLSNVRTSAMTTKYNIFLNKMLSSECCWCFSTRLIIRTTEHENKFNKTRKSLQDNEVKRGEIQKYWASWFRNCIRVYSRWKRRGDRILGSKIINARLNLCTRFF